MTKAVRDRILKDVNGNISDHLRNHIHLTNCIHLKNHMHKQSPILADRALMRDLVVLQRSRSLRDPSASPPSWHSPSVAEMLYRRGERDGVVNGRRSIGLEHSKEGGWASGNSPQNDGDEIRNHRRVEKEESSGRSLRNNALRLSEENQLDVNDRVSGNSDLRDKRLKKKEGYSEERQYKNYSDRLKDVLSESDDAVSSHNHGNRRNINKIADVAEANVRSHGNSVNRARRRKFRGARRNRPSVTARDVEIQNDMSVASNSFAQAVRKHHEEEGAEEFDDQRMSGVPRNGCGIPFNWSRIHHRGKSFLDMAGRSLSCGLSDPRLKKGGSVSRGRHIPDMAVMSDHSSSSLKSDAEALPLLFEASGSQGSVDHGAWQHDYSGELGLFADNLLKQETDSDLASEGRSREKHNVHGHRTNRHQNLTQKYMPRTFKDLVGQNLVVQALSNAVVKKKVGLLYVFYGPPGTGKTSCARMFARALNCQSLEPPKPCGYCNACIAHDMGKSRYIKEVGPVANVDFENVIEVLDNITVSKLQSQYRVFIFDECDTLSSHCWSAILKVIDRAPRRVVFILVCSSLDALPHIIISRCQKFFFPKLKDADIIYTLQLIATKEDLEIDKDALKLIASRSDGSLRDAEMTLEQLSLLGQRITLCLVQELVGLISDEKLVDLLDLALSADTVNTVKNLREIMESGIEPLALMSQLATVITDILAGSYDFLKEKSRRKFFRRQTLTKEDMEKLRQALKTLSEAEKQLRVSNDKMTWLTAALLQLAPDQQYMLPSSSADTSLNQSPLFLQNSALRERPRKSNAELPTFQTGHNHNSVLRGTMNGKVHVAGGSVSQQMSLNDRNVQFPGFRKGIEEIWLDVLEEIPHTSVKEFMYREGKLISLSYGEAPTVQLEFSSKLNKSKAEKVRSYILQAFEAVLRSPVTVEIRCKTINSGTGQMLNSSQDRDTSSALANRSEIVEIEASPRQYRSTRHTVDKGDADRQNTRKTVVGGTNSSANGKRLGDRSQSLSLVKGKVSLAHVIQHAEGCSQNGWSKRKAVSIAEKLEQENLRLEPRSRRLLCWNPPRVSRRKLSRLKIRPRKPHALLKFVSCGRCLSSKSPR